MNTETNFGEKNTVYLIIKKIMIYITTYLSLFFVSKFLSIPSIKFSNHCAIAACLSTAWLLIIFSRN